MITIIAGTRTLAAEMTQRAVKECPWKITAVVCGEARGPDTHGKQYGQAQGIPVSSHPADWVKLGKGAGFARNEDMAHEADALLAVWDGQSNGTRHMIEYMQSLGKPVHIFKASQQTARATMKKNLFYHAESDCAFLDGRDWVDYCDMMPADKLPAGCVIDNVGMGQSTVYPSFDFETYSEAGFVIDENTGKVHTAAKTGNKNGLSLVGTPVYAEHPSTEILCLYYDLKDGKGRRAYIPGGPEPLDLIEHIRNMGPIEAWNITFEWWIWNMVCARRMGWPFLQFEQSHCAMAKSRRYSMPGALGQAAKALGTEDKDKAGKQLINKLCRPVSATKKRPQPRWTIETAAEDYINLFKYCDQDVKTEDHAAALIPDLTPSERETWLADQRINARGVMVDVPSLDNCLDVVGQTTRLFTKELVHITDGAVGSVSEVAKMLDFLRAHSCYLPDLTADTVKDALKRDDVTPLARRVLEIREALGGANVKKLFSLKAQTSSDGRLRNQYTFFGAATGRWSAGGVQLQNLTSKGPKSKTCGNCGRIVGKDCTAEVMGHTGLCPECGADDWTDNNDWTVDGVRCALSDIATRDLTYIMHVWGDPIKLLSGCLRGLLIAPKTKKLVCCDFSAIEAVVLAAVARCEWRIDVFRTHGKIYEMSASKIAGVPFEDFAKYKADNGFDHPLRKSLGKVAELACFTRDTQVLTKRGYAAIVDVTHRDYLWDGVEWVTSSGVVHKGQKDVIQVDGVLVTPEHPVSINGSWKPASELASNKSTLSQALATGSESIQSLITKNGATGEGPFASALAGPYGSLTLATFTLERLAAAVLVGARSLSRRTSSFILNMRTYCPTLSTAGAWLTDCAQRSHGATARTAEGTRTTADEAFKSVTNGAAKMAQGVFSSTFSPSTDGTSLALRWTGATPTATMRPEMSALSADERTPRTKGLSSKCRNESTNLRNVFDIVNAGPRSRFTIKTDSGHMVVHNSGYGGWLGAWKAFGAEAHFADDEEMKQAILGWRGASPEIVEFWGGQRRKDPYSGRWVDELFGLEGAAIAAIQNPGKCYMVGDITYGVKDDVLFCRLPSGRFLQYHEPRLVEQEKWGKLQQAITFMGYNSNSQKGPVGWTRMDTYGGRLCENVVQAIAADIQSFAMKQCENNGYPVVMHTHDELIAEVDEHFGSVGEMAALMTAAEPWRAWWPIRAAGWQDDRYQKD